MPLLEPFRVQVKDLMELMTKSIEQGMSVPQLLNDLDLPEDFLADPNALIDMDDCWRIIIANQNAIDEESHLISSRPLKRGTTRFVLSSLYHCKTLEEGLTQLAQSYNIIHGGDYNFVRRRGNILSYLVKDQGFHYLGKPNPLAIEFALLKIHCAVCYLAGKPLKLLRMATRRPALPAHHHHLLLFNTRLIAGQEYYELAYDCSQAELTLTPSDNLDIAGNIYAHYLNLLRQRAREPSDNALVQQVLQLIRTKALQGTLPAQGAVAQTMHMSVATLRRKLSDADTSFRKLQDKVLCELAINHLHEHMSPAEVAERLGFSDVRSFKRAFKRWYAVSPAAYVKSHGLLR